MEREDGMKQRPTERVRGRANRWLIVMSNAHIIYCVSISFHSAHRTQPPMTVVVGLEKRNNNSRKKNARAQSVEINALVLIKLQMCLVAPANH